MSLEYLDDAAVNQQIMDSLIQAIEQCHQAYAGQSKSFAVLLHDLEKLLLQCQHKLTLGSDAGVEDINQSQQTLKTTDAATEKLVFVRLFHKQMPTLAEEHASLVWVRSLLESIKTAEKHGLAIYNNEEDVQRSLKNERYAYATLKVTNEQDVTEQHAAKVDPELGCPLLTIKAIHVENLLKLTYAGKHYTIKKGTVYRPE